LILDRWDTQSFLAWVEDHQPDAIVTKLPEVLYDLKRAGYRVPDDVGVAFHSLDEESRELSGMKKNSFQIGVMAVDLLVDMLHRNCTARKWPKPVQGMSAMTRTPSLASASSP
jgi:LacI family transcriptional regulator